MHSNATSKVGLTLAEPPCMLICMTWKQLAKT